MTASQRAALLDLCRAIRAVKHGPVEIHDRADALERMLDPLSHIRRRLGL